MSAMLYAALACSETDPVPEADGIITLSDAPQLIVIQAEPHEAVTLGITCDSDWNVLPSSSWMVVTPVSGKGTLDGAPENRTVYITAYVNDKAVERKGSVTFSSAVSNISIPVVQLPEAYTSDLNVSLPQNSGGISADGAFWEVKVFATSAWTLSVPDWMQASASAGEAYSTAAVILSVAANLGKEVRTGTIRIWTEKGDEYTLPVEQTFNPDRDLLACWTVGDNDFMANWDASHSYCWTGYGSIIADKPESTSANAVWHVGAQDSSERSYLISSDAAGHWAVKPTWIDDYMQFTVPLANVEAGDSVRFRAAIQTNVSSVPKDWAVEHLDSGVWVKDSDYALSAIKVACEMEEGWRLTPAMVSAGSLSVRIRCTSTRSLGGNLSSPAVGSALRIVPRVNADESDPNSKFITFTVIR